MHASHAVQNILRAKTHPHRQSIDVKANPPIRSLAPVHPPEQNCAEHHVGASGNPRQNLRKGLVEKACRAHPEAPRPRPQAPRQSCVELKTRLLNV